MYGVATLNFASDIKFKFQIFGYGGPIKFDRLLQYL